MTKLHSHGTKKRKSPKKKDHMLYGIDESSVSLVRLHLHSKQSDSELSRAQQRQASRALKKFDEGDPTLAIAVIEQDLKGLIPKKSPDHARLSACVTLMRRHLPG